MSALARRMGLIALLLALSLITAACANDSTDEEATEDAAAATDEEPTEDEMAEEEPTEDEMAEEEPTEDEMAEEEPTEDEATEDEAADASEGGVSIEDSCAQYEGVEVPEDFNVVLVTDIGKVDDGTFNQFANDGMVAAADCLGFESQAIETASEADYATNISTAVSKSVPSIR